MVWLMTRISPFCRISAPVPAGDSKLGTKAGSSRGKPVYMGENSLEILPTGQVYKQCLQITQEPVADR